MKTLSIALIALSGMTASAALAATNTEPSSEAAGTAPAPKRATNHQYCVTERLTESRIPRRTCQTRAEWARDGVDIDDLMK